MKSLDVFDTALLRTVYQPTDIFKLVEQDVCRDFYQKRREAERQASIKYPFYNVYNIYEFLPEFNVADEIRAELNNCKANPKILEMYNKNPEDFIFISDMYLPSKIIARMLESIGYKNPRVFVSCEMKAQKRGGALFKKVQDYLKLRIQKHYGDNYVADIEGAKMAGIPEVEFSPALHNIKLPIPVVRDVRLKKYLAEVMASNRPREEKIALLFVPVIVGFTKWVLSQRKPGQKIFFLSRDMITPYIVAKKYLNAEDVYYLHASRRSIASAWFRSKDPDILAKANRIIVNQQERNEFLRRDPNEIVKYLSKFDIKNGDFIVDVGYSGTIQAVIEDLLNIKTKGLYVQIFPEIKFNIDAIEYLRRRVITCCMLLEVPLGSSEDLVEDYKNGQVVYKPENEKRKALARVMTKAIVDQAKELIDWPISIMDVEQVLIHTQNYLDNDLLQVFNQPIFSNIGTGESLINFDKKEILKGRLKELANRSFNRSLFKKMLEADPELSHLSSLV